MSHRLKRILTGASIVLLSLSFAAITPAQEAQQQGQQMAPQQQMNQKQTNIKVSDQELQKFSNVVNAAQTIQQKAQSKMVKAIQDEGLTIDQYNSIVKQQQNAQAQGQQQSANVPEEQVNKVRAASQKVGQIQTESQQKVVSAIQDEGMQPQRFQQILMAVRNNPDLQQRFQDMNQESSNN